MNYNNMTDEEYAAACAAAREEIAASQARIRAEVNEMPIRLLVDKFLARRQQRTEDAQAAGVERWGTPSVSHGTAGLAETRSMRVLRGRGIRYR
jgi:hypothetical protein